VWLRWPGRPDPHRAVADRRVLTGTLRAACIVGWLVVLAWAYWHPWSFRAGMSQWRSRLASVCWFPFTDYYWGTEYHAFDEFYRKFLLAMPLGLLLAGAGSSRSAAMRGGLRLGFIALVSVAIEAGQLLLPGRFPSVTDSLIYFLGGWCGMLLSHWWRSLRELPVPSCPVPAERG
jgi:VanZ family protein